MVAAFIRERGVTVCPPRTVDGGYKATANGHETSESFLFREASAPRTPEQRLAAAKILIMLQDLGGVNRGCGAGATLANQIHAERWFFGRSDFELWCETAGLNPETVRKSASKVKENGFPKEKFISTGRSPNAQYQLEWQRRRRAKQRGLQ